MRNISNDFFPLRVLSRLPKIRLRPNEHTVCVCHLPHEWIMEVCAEVSFTNIFCFCFGSIYFFVVASKARIMTYRIYCAIRASMKRGDIVMPMRWYPNNCWFMVKVDELNILLWLSCTERTAAPYPFRWRIMRMSADGQFIKDKTYHYLRRHPPSQHWTTGACENKHPRSRWQSTIDRHKARVYASSQRVLLNENCSCEMNWKCKHNQKLLKPKNEEKKKKKLKNQTFSLPFCVYSATQRKRENKNRITLNQFEHPMNPFQTLNIDTNWVKSQKAVKNNWFVAAMPYAFPFRLIRNWSGSGCEMGQCLEYLHSHWRFAAASS